MTPSEIQYYVQKRREGWDNSQVRKDLLNSGHSKEDIFFFVNEIDDIFIKGINDKSELSVGNFSLRVFELVFGIFLLLIGLYLLAVCFVVGPALLNLLIGVPATSGGYYFVQRGLKGLKDIRKTAKDKALIVKDDSVLDN
ncbi:MAG: hypothetical protein ABF242_01180 [Flavobacteriales bacterium]